MFARVARYDVEPDRTGEAIEAFREAVTQLEGENGLKGGYVLADWESAARHSRFRAGLQAFE
jgi:heme-degrading monooxygenase HmoA